MSVEAVPEQEEWPQLEAWAANVLERSSGEWIIPENYSMRAALDRLWSRNEKIEKWWIDGQNAYRLMPRGQAQ